MVEEERAKLCVQLDQVREAMAMYDIPQFSFILHFVFTLQVEEELSRMQEQLVVKDMMLNKVCARALCVRMCARVCARVCTCVHARACICVCVRPMPLHLSNLSGFTHLVRFSFCVPCI